MHELAVCQALIDQVEQTAQNQCAARVTQVKLGIGPLSGVESRLLAQAYSIATAGTVAEGSCLEIEVLPVRVCCSSCGKESEVKPNKLVCVHCGDWRTTLVSGDELLLLQVELEKDCGAPRSLNSLATEHQGVRSAHLNSQSCGDDNV